MCAVGQLGGVEPEQNHGGISPHLETSRQFLPALGVAVRIDRHEGIALVN